MRVSIRAIAVVLGAAIASMPAAATPNTTTLQAGTLQMTGIGGTVRAATRPFQAAGPLTMTGAGGTGVHSPTVLIQAGTLIMTGTP